MTRAHVTGAGTGAPRVAVIGLGGMGGGIARRLVEQGVRVTVWNRTRAKAAPIGEAGATVADSPAAAAKDADVVVVSLSDENVVTEVLDAGLEAALEPGTLLLDATTVSPTYAQDAGVRLGALGVHRLEMCLVGNPAMAASGGLRVFTAGDPAVAAKAAPVLDAISSQVRHIGGPGTASVLKLAFNMLLGAQVSALAEAVALGEAAGLGRDELLDVVTDSGFSSAVLAFRGRFMRSGEYRPAAFRSALMEKDLRLACAAAQQRGMHLDVTDAVRARFSYAVAAGAGDSDAAVVLEFAGHHHHRPGGTSA